MVQSTQCCVHACMCMGVEPGVGGGGGGGCYLGAERCIDVHIIITIIAIYIN